MTFQMPHNIMPGVLDMICTSHIANNIFTHIMNTLFFSMKDQSKVGGCNMKGKFTGTFSKQSKFKSKMEVTINNEIT